MTPRQYAYRVGGWHYLVRFLRDDEQAGGMLASSEPFSEEPSSHEEPLFVLEVDDAFRPAERGASLAQLSNNDAHFEVFRNSEGDYTFHIADPHLRQCALLQTDCDFRRAHAALGRGFSARKYGLTNALMLLYAFASADKYTLLMHASVVRRQGVAYAFLGESGTGKSTHTAHWLSYLEGCDLLNDDNPVVRIMDGQVMVYGSPWSGKTPCYRNVQAPLGAFVQLVQAPRNAIRRQQTIEAYASLAASCSLMPWEEKRYNGVCDTINRLLSLTPAYRLENLPDEEAVHLCHDTIATPHAATHA